MLEHSLQEQPLLWRSPTAASFKDPSSETPQTQSLLKVWSLPKALVCLWCDFALSQTFALAHSAHPPVHHQFSSLVNSLTHLCSADFPIQEVNAGISQDTSCGGLGIKSFAFPHRCQLLLLQQKTECTHRLWLLLLMGKPEGSTPSVITVSVHTDCKSLHAVSLFHVPLLHHSGVQAVLTTPAPSKTVWGLTRGKTASLGKS